MLVSCSGACTRAVVVRLVRRPFLGCICPHGVPMHAAPGLNFKDDVLERNVAKEWAFWSSTGIVAEVHGELDRHVLGQWSELSSRAPKTTLQTVGTCSRV